MTKNKFRTEKPTRTFTRKLEHYTSYRKYLSQDFNGRCGYCNDKQHLSCFSTSFHIDHYIPKKKFESIYDVHNYSNLVYSCPYCNLSKTDYWVCNDPNISVKNDEGIVDPCSNEYDILFKRDSSGKIIPQTKLAEFMRDQLKLDLKRHEILHKLEKLELIVDTYSGIIESGNLEQKDESKVLILFHELYKLAKYLNIKH